MTQKTGPVYVTSDGQEFADRVAGATHELCTDLKTLKENEGRDEINPFFFAHVVGGEKMRILLRKFLTNAGDIL